MTKALPTWGRPIGLALTVAVAAPLTELFLFRRYGASPVPGPYELDGTVSGGPADGRCVGLVWLGDSLSAGVGADHPGESFPSQTASEVARRQSWDVELICLAVPGAASIDVLTGQVPTAMGLLGEGSTAVVAVGCNDVLRLVRVSAFRVTYAAILRALIDTGATVVAVGLPDLGSMMAVMAQPLRALVGRAGRRLDRTIRDVADETGASYVAIDDGRSVSWCRRSRETLSSDGWHPNGAGYRIWAGRVAVHLADLGSGDLR